MASSSSPSFGPTSRARFARNVERQPSQEQRDTERPSIQLPPQFRARGGDDEADEERDNIESAADDSVFQQRSLYGMIAQTGSISDFTQRWQQEIESGSEAEQELDGTAPPVEDTRKAGSTSKLEGKQTKSLSNDSRTQRKRLSQNTLLRSFLKPNRDRSDSDSQDPMTQSQFLPSREEAFKVPERPASTGVGGDVSIMDRKLQAQANAGMNTSGVSTTGRRSLEEMDSGSKKLKAAVSLPQALAEIFQLEEPEDVISEYACWYLQSVLLQGYMYITQRHVCFYAYLQRKSNVLTKSGHLGKRGKQNPRYNRYWVTVKGDILSYYTNAAQPYFPSGTIDLRFAISAELSPEKGKDRESTLFNVTTDKRTYHFKADSMPSAKEWVKQLQKVIFRSHNDGDSVKILIPLDNIVDVESNPMVGQADTVRIRVIDNDETFAVDEYFFTFFHNGNDALKVLSTMTRGNDATRTLLAAEENDVGSRARSRNTLTKRSSSLEKADSSRVSSSDSSGRRVNRGSILKSNQRHARSRSPLAPSAQESTDSIATTTELMSESASRDTDEVDMSASQMLTGDAAFRAPTIRFSSTTRTVPASTSNKSRNASREHPRLPRSAEVEPHTSHTHVPKQADHSVNQSKAHIASSSTEPLENVHELESKLNTTPDNVNAHSARPTVLTLQHAASMVGYVRDQGKKMGSYLSNSPRDYYGKFSGALAGGKRHYSEADGLAPEDRIDDPEDELETAEHERRFQEHFALPETEKLTAVFYASLHRVLPLYGKIYIGTRWFCFRSLLYGTRTKIVLPLKEIDNVEKEKGFRLGYPGMVLVVRGHEELFFDFKNYGLRDDCVVTILRGLDTVQAIQESITLTAEEQLGAATAAAEHELLQTARQVNVGKGEDMLPNDPDFDAAPIFFDDPNASMLEFTPKESMRITCLTIGSRGDIQPYIALCKGFQAEGHRPKIATHVEFKGWVESHGIEFAAVEGNPAELMQLCVEYGMFTPQFIYETNSKFRGWLDTLLVSAWDACQNTDLLIESPSAMAGIHIAEALGVPYFRAFTMPWTRTRAYPHAFAALHHKMGGQYNISTYTVFEGIFWQMTAHQVNRWRGKTLRIGPTSMAKMQQNKIPFLYNFSPSVVVPPLDFSDWVRVTGYWFLDEGKGWTPPSDLLAFIEKARHDKMKLVYIGFGSVVVSNSKAMTQNIVDAVLKADVRCILSKGWSDRLDAKSASAAELPLPPSIFKITSAPHDWLFKQVDAAVHHGGAGTTGASLRAGVPTIIKPFFGDQYFFATRVEDLGVGLRIKHVTQNTLGKALWLATHDDRMRNKARILGERIRAENGVQTAINAIYRDLEYAKTLIRRRNVQRIEDSSHQQVDEDDDTEESWTFIESESDLSSSGIRHGEPLDPGVYQHQEQRSHKHEGRDKSSSLVMRGRMA